MLARVTRTFSSGVGSTFQGHKDIALCEVCIWSYLVVGFRLGMENWVRAVALSTLAIERAAFYIFFEEPVGGS